MKKEIRYFKAGKACTPDQADEVRIVELDDEGKLLDEMIFKRV